MKSDQLIEQKVKFCQNFFSENEAGRLVPDFFLFFKTSLSEEKARGQH